MWAPLQSDSYILVEHASAIIYTKHIVPTETYTKHHKPAPQAGTTSRHHKSAPQISI